MNTNELEISELHRLFSYNPDTGHLKWRVTSSPTGAVGSIAGSIKPSGYVVVCIAGRYYRAHRIAYAMHYGAWPQGEVDHINRKRDDNRALNLRDCTRTENSLNRGLHTNNRSGFRGVAFDQRRQLWMASIKVSGRTIFLGRYSTPELAAEQYEKARSLYRQGKNA